ncbi:L,D-transpeptidase family protein [Sphingomonas sp.]|uniref:L,D-transpeptidase family protein n=1 Tax=Sphingomonas sp. TaxID=28214 RepID=UPI003CC5DE65
MKIGRFGFAGLTALAMLAAAPALAADDQPGVALLAAASTLTANQFVWNDTDTGEAVRIVVNIAEQRAYVYRGEALIAATAVSTGRDGLETPSGTFTVLEKAIDHRSNRYNNAAMPFMQRLTWDGVAIHAGANPGFPTSHGCVHVPLAFAKKLYGVTSVGTAVTIIGADGEIGPATSASPVPDSSAGETAAANRAAVEVARR